MSRVPPVTALKTSRETKCIFRFTYRYILCGAKGLCNINVSYSRVELGSMPTSENSLVGWDIKGIFMVS